MRYFIYLCLLVCSTLFAQTNELLDAAATNTSLAKQVHFAKPIQSTRLVLPTKIAIEDSGSNFFVIKALVNGQGPYQFLIDTGTSFTLFSKKIVTELNLPHIINLPFTVNGQTQNVDFYHLKELTMGDATLRDYDIVVFQEPSLIQHFREEKKIEIEGILGFGAFNDYVLTLDFPKMQVLLQNNELSMDDKDTIPYIHNRLVPMISVLFKDSAQQSNLLRFVVDSGFSGSFFMPATTKEVPFKINETKNKAVLTGLGRFDVVENMIEATAYFANQKVESPDIMYGSEIYGKTTSPFGLMGLKVINQFRLSFDQKNYLIKIESGSLQLVKPQEVKSKEDKTKEKPNVP